MIDCPKAAERDLAPLYLAGKLDHDQAEAFEEHILTCESCRSDVERGSELRAMFGRAPVVAARRRDDSRLWLPLAAAAAIALVGVGVWQLTRRTPAPPAVLRSVEGTVAGLKVSPRAGGGFDLEWAPSPRAASYEVEVFAPDGTRLWKTAIREPRVEVPPDVLRAGAPGQRYEIRIEALDPLGRVIASGAIQTSPNQ